jgi:two-component system OmpR family sensor kinase/two-component system sensor histidine kinase BaeS
MRRGFLRRIVLVVALLFGLTVLANVAAVGLLYAFGIHFHGRLAPFASVAGVSLLVGFVATARAARRVAGPVADVMDAAERVSHGDYGVRVQEQGSRHTRRLARSFNTMAERLEAAETARQDLFADVAHELRTPLSVIRGSLEGIVDGLYPADEEHLGPAVHETEVMARLLEDLGTLSTAEAGALRLHREPTDPGRLMADTAAAFQGQAAAAGVELHTQTGRGLPEIDVDPVRIKEVLANLVQNAIRVTPSGGTVGVSTRTSEAGGEIEFAVEDTGPGIPPEELPHVFDRFVKSAESRGAGLGLAIAKSLVEAHGGRIAVQSEPANGTTVRFTLPLRPVD